MSYNSGPEQPGNQPQYPNQPYPNQPQFPPAPGHYPQHGQIPPAQGQYPPPGQYQQPQPGQGYYQAPQAPLQWQQESPAPKPGGGTAIAAAVLALLGCIHMVVQLVTNSVDSTDFGTDDLDTFIKDNDTLGTMVTILFVVCGLTLVLLLAGAVMIFLRNMIGRYLVIGGSVIYIIGAIVQVSLAFSFLDEVKTYANDNGYIVDQQYLDAFQLGMAIVLLGLLIFPVVTIILAAVPSTGRWIAAKQS